MPPASGPYVTERDSQTKKRRDQISRGSDAPISLAAEDLFILLISWPKQSRQSSSRSPAKFAGHTPPPVDSFHPRLQDQALGATDHNLDGNRGSCDLHCRRSSELRPQSNSCPWELAPPVGEKARLPVESSRRLWGSRRGWP